MSEIWWSYSLVERYFELFKWKFVYLAMNFECQHGSSNNHLIRSVRGPNQLKDDRWPGDVKQKALVATDDLQNSTSNTHFLTTKANSVQR